MIDFFASIAAGEYDHVQQMLKDGQDPNQIDEVGDTPLAIAIQNDRIWIVELLLEGGADPDLKSSDGVSAREWAQLNGRLKLLAKNAA